MASAHAHTKTMHTTDFVIEMTKRIRSTSTMEIENWKYNFRFIFLNKMKIIPLVEVHCGKQIYGVTDVYLIVCYEISRM